MRFQSKEQAFITLIEKNKVSFIDGRNNCKVKQICIYLKFYLFFFKKQLTITVNVTLAAEYENICVTYAKNMWCSPYVSHIVVIQPELTGIMDNVTLCFF